jgi:hypothetical protein
MPGRRNPTSYEGCEIATDGAVTDIFFHAEILREGDAQERDRTRDWLARQGYSQAVIDRVMGADQPVEKPE